MNHRKLLETFYRKLQIDGELLGAARPTAVNLRWAVGEMLNRYKLFAATGTSRCGMPL